MRYFLTDLTVRDSNEQFGVNVHFEDLKKVGFVSDLKDIQKIVTNHGYVVWESEEKSPTVHTCSSCKNKKYVDEDHLGNFVSEIKDTFSRLKKE